MTATCRLWLGTQILEQQLGCSGEPNVSLPRRPTSLRVCHGDQRARDLGHEHVFGGLYPWA